MAILDEWIEDLPQQFQNKEHIETLIRAFSKQIEELLEVFRQLDTQTDLESAVGNNLDMVGDIVTLTRKEAGILAGIDVEDPVISDERYRQFLKYQMLVNTNECTYHDLMNGLALLWDVSPIYYKEEPALPAVIILTMPFLTPGGKVVTLGEVPMVKPAGVRIEFQYYIQAIVEIAFNFWISSYDVPHCNTIVCGTHPYRSTLGNILAIECENDVNAIIAAFDASPTGTIRIGGRAYNATLGNIFGEDIEIEIDRNLQIVDFLQSGQSVSGVNPEKAAKGIIIPKDILVDGSTYTNKYRTDRAGKKTSGGGDMEESALLHSQNDIEVNGGVLLGTPTQISASPERRSGGGSKTVSLSDESEAAVNVYIATARVRRCGTVSCGNKE